MSLYPPLSEEQIRRIARHAAKITDARSIVNLMPVMIPASEREVDELVRSIAEMRGKVAALDRLLFQTWELVRRERESNVPTSLPETKKRPPSLDELGDLL